ncbi:MAG: biotin-dependent carboxyltransferase family protein [Prolixibacteraceae bacterium]|nr:biotin-dependent carboxyltransferase family protein [Burkholderiales bacterium]
MSITVLKPGMLSTLQDGGRYGFQHLGVPVSGAMDFFSHRIANILAANGAGEATLEITLRGPRLRFDEDALIALCGADLSPSIDGIPAPEGKAIRVQAGAVLDFGDSVAGCRAYLAIHGGFDVPVVMGSRSTYDTAHIGGLEGRALRRGDVLPLGSATSSVYPGLARTLAASKRSFAAPKWAVNQHIEKLGRSLQIVRILAGRHWDAFPTASREGLTAQVFRIAPDSNRMGCRLDGADDIAGGVGEILSEAVTFGTIQVPPSGKPIVLMADRQTVGGYPKIAEVVSVDLHLLAQLRPGDRLRFELVSLAQAQALWLKREQEIITIREAVEKHLTE